MQFFSKHEVYKGNCKTALPSRYHQGTLFPIKLINGIIKTSASSSIRRGFSGFHSCISFFFLSFFLARKGKCSLCYSKNARDISKYVEMNATKETKKRYFQTKE